MKHEAIIVYSNHMDLVWKRPWADYVEIQCDIINKALDMLNRYEQFHIFVEQAAVLETYLAWYPENEKALRRFIAEGRFEIIGGAFALVDLNMPLGESLIRNYLIGAKLIDGFGRKTTVGCLADAFGQCAQMPQIMAGFGLTHTFPGRNVGAVNSASPEETPFVWVGADGSRIVNGFRNAGATFGFYEPMNTPWVIDQARESIERTAKDTPLCACWLTSEEVLPRRNVFEGLLALAAQTEDVKITFGTMKQYFNQLDHLVASGELELPTFVGEFNPLFTGCYTMRSAIKQANTALQNRLLGIEALQCCRLANPASPPPADLEHVWRKVLLNQFHDSMCGCVSAEAFSDIIGRYESANAQLDALFPASATGRQHLFNPLPYERSAIVALKDAKGEADIDGFVPQQVLVDGTLHVRVPAMPSLGTIAVDFHKGSPQTLRRTDKAWIENAFYRIRLGDGCIGSIESPGTQMRLGSGVGELIVREDKGGFWTTQPTGKTHAATTLEQHTEDSGLLQRIISRGEIRGAQWNGAIQCAWQREIRLWSGEDRIDFIYKLDWVGSGCDLSVAIPTLFCVQEASYETPFAVLQRPVYAERLAPFAANRGGEWPSLRFVSAGGADWGVSIVHEGCHGIIWNGREFIVNLLHSPDDHNLECGAVCWDLSPVDGAIPEPTAQETGAHEFRFSVRLHQGNWSAGQEIGRAHV